MGKYEFDIFPLCPVMREDGRVSEKLRHLKGICKSRVSVEMNVWLINLLVETWKGLLWWHSVWWCIQLSRFCSFFAAKSLPLHCVVESVPSLQASFQLDSRSPWRRRPNIETDSYVIVPAATPFCDIVTIALQRLGYSSDISNTAKGKRWRERFTTSDVMQC